MCGIYLSKADSGEEKYSCRPAKLPRSVPSNRMVFSLWVFDDICRDFDFPHVDLFTTRTNAKLHINVSPIDYPMAWKEDAFQHRGQPKLVCLASFGAVLASLVKNNALSDPSSSIVATERVIPGPSGSFGARTS